MGRRSSGFFIAVNILVSIAVAVGAILLFTALQGEEEAPRALPTIVVIVTATPDPNQPLSADQLQSTVDAQAGTVVALQRQLADSQAELAIAQADAGQTGEEGESPNIPPPPSGNADITVNTPSGDLPTIPPELIPPLPNAGSDDDAVADGGSNTGDDECQTYFVQAGDTASTIASRFEVPLSDLFVLNGINDQTILQVGDELLIPSEGCEPEIPPTSTPVPQPTFDLSVATPNISPTPSPTIETAEDSQIEIVQITNIGDITTEQVELRNRGGELNLSGWTLEDEDNNVFAFPDVRMAPNGVIRISTCSGTNTPGFLFWNLNEPVWSNGELATLRDADETVQAVLTVGGESEGEVIEFPTPSDDE